MNLLKIFLDAEIKSQRMLNELLVVGEVENESYVVAFHKHVFIFKSENSDEYIENIIDKLNLVWKNNAIRNNSFFIKRKYVSVPLDETLKRMQSLVVDIFIGKIIANENVLYVYNFGEFDGEHSPYFQQIQRQLNIWDVVTSGYIGDEGVKFITNNEIKSLPDIGFHGTSSKYLTSILRLGIRIDQPSNWKEVQHVKYIFFATRSIKSLLHAQRISTFQNSTPIVVEFRIPNKNRITQDFDIEKYTGTKSVFGNVKSDIPKQAISNKPMSLSKNKGIYAYIGDIPPQHIKAIWVPLKEAETYFEDDFVRMAPKEALKHLQLFSP